MSWFWGEDVVNDVVGEGMKVVLLVVRGYEWGCDGWW